MASRWRLPYSGAQRIIVCTSYNGCHLATQSGTAALVHVKKQRSPTTHHEGAWGGRGSIAPTHSRPRHSMVVSGQRHAPATLYPRGKDPSVPIVQEAGLAPEPVWTQRLKEKSFAPVGDRTTIDRSSSP
jgi:hypothetical protein